MLVRFQLGSPKVWLTPSTREHISLVGTLIDYEKEVTHMSRLLFCLLSYAHVAESFLFLFFGYKKQIRYGMVKADEEIIFDNCRNDDGDGAVGAGCGGE